MEVPLLHDRLLAPTGDFAEPFDIILASVMVPEPDAEWFKTRFAMAQEKIDELRALRVTRAQLVAGRLVDFYSMDSVSFTLPPGIETEWLTAPRVTATFLLGEFLSSIRNSLDYLVFVLSWRNKGHPLDGTAFPLCVREASWQQSKGSLRGLTPEQRRVVKEHQPFGGHVWTQHLAHFSNIDKHSSPVEALPRITARINPSGQTITNSQGRSVPYIEHIDVDYDFYIGHSTRSKEAIRAIPVMAEMQWGALHLYHALTHDPEVRETIRSRELQQGFEIWTS